MFRHLIADLESHDITPHLIHRAAHGPASAYIICSQEDGSRTIVSHTNSIPDPSAAELQSTLCETPDGWPEWIHVEGRTCIAVLEFLTHIKSLGFNGKISVDFERPRDGLRALLPQADVLFISRTYAEHLISDTPGFPHTPENPAEPPETPFVRRVLRAIENEIKPGASGHILLGAAGCFCFSRYDQENAVTETLSRVCSDLIQTPSSGQCQTEQSNGLFLFAFRRIGPLQTDVVESVGAGDSFVAGALWSYLNGSTWIDANAFATQIAGWKCTVNGFRGLWELLRGDNPRGRYMLEFLNSGRE
jgi:ketohexokinase